MEKKVNKDVLVNCGQIPIFVDRIVSAEDLEVGDEIAKAPYDGRLYFVVDNTHASFFQKEVTFKIRDVSTDTSLFPSNTPTTSSSTTTAMLSKGYISYLLSGNVLEKDEKEFRVRVPNGRKVSFHVDVTEGSRIKFRMSVDRKDVKLTAIFQMNVYSLWAIRDAYLSMEEKNKTRLDNLRSQLENLKASETDLESSLIEERAKSKVEVKTHRDEVERLNNVVCEMAENEKKRRDKHEKITSDLKRMLDRIKKKHETEILKMSESHKQALEDYVFVLKEDLSRTREEKIETLEKKSRDHEVIVETLKKSHAQMVENLRQDHKVAVDNVTEAMKKTHHQEMEKLREDYESRMKDLDLRIHDL